MHPKGELVSCDFSKEMVTKMKERYAQSDLSKDKEGFSVFVSTDLDHTLSGDSQCEGLIPDW